MLPSMLVIYIVQQPVVATRAVVFELVPEPPPVEFHSGAAKPEVVVEANRVAVLLLPFVFLRKIHMNLP